MDAAAISDMLQAAQTVVRYVAGKSREDYEREDQLRHAVERNIEIIGEATRRLSSEFIHAHPEIPGREIIGRRHVLAHDYDEVDNDIVWLIVTDHVRTLIERLGPLPPPPPPEATPE